jgi:hypothetical protein
MTTPFTDVPADSTLVPPQGAVFGSETLALGPFSQSLGWTDDRAIASQTQTANGSGVSEYYVYWVNGVTNPYYVIIQRITGSFSPGTTLATGPASYGFFQTGVTISNVLASPNASASLLGYSPGTFVSGSGGSEAPVTLSVPMILSLPSSGGWAPQQFMAQEQAGIPLPDWAILDQSQPGKLSQQTCFHQLNPWDPTAHPPEQWPYWYSYIYDGNDNTAAPATFSTGSLRFEVIVAWMLTPNNPDAMESAPPTPPSLPITLSTTFSQDVAAWHNMAGCLSTFKGSGPLPNISGAHHIHAVHGAFPPSMWAVDLQTIVKR